MFYWVFVVYFTWYVITRFMIQVANKKNEPVFIVLLPFTVELFVLAYLIGLLFGVVDESDLDGDK